MTRSRQMLPFQARALPVLLVAFAAVGCNSKQAVDSPPPQQAVPQVVTLGSATASADAPLATSSSEPAGHDEGHPVREPPVANVAQRLSPEAAGRVTTLRVMGHVGSVIVRKRGADWVTGGASGCTVPPARIARALANLTTLESSRSTDSVPIGTAIGMQIVVQIGEELALNFDIVEHGAAGDLVRLGDDSTHRVRGLDRRVWVADPAAWCTEL